jgi:hypothetical protein
MSIRDGVRALGIEVRAGLHTGECEVRGDDIGGIGVHIPSVHQYCKSSTAQENSGDVSTVRRRGPDPLVPLAHRTVSAP